MDTTRSRVMKPEPFEWELPPRPELRRIGNRGNSYYFEFVRISGENGWQVALAWQRHWQEHNVRTEVREDMLYVHYYDYVAAFSVPVEERIERLKKKMGR